MNYPHSKLVTATVSPSFAHAAGSPHCAYSIRNALDVDQKEIGAIVTQSVNLNTHYLNAISNLIANKLKTQFKC